MIKPFTHSQDMVPISFEVSGSGKTALLFVHGWLGNKNWWSEQEKAFKDDFLIVRMDLAGHGDSGKARENYSSRLYADDIVAVAGAISAEKIILVGHSMSGAYAVEAAPEIANLQALILVDTLKDLDQLLAPELISSFLDVYRKDFKKAVYEMLPAYLFSNGTPAEVQTKLQKEFLSHDWDFAANALEPFYTMDLQSMAPSLKIPVRAINSDNSPTNKQVNQKYFKDFDFSEIKGTGHYPMLERPNVFNTVFKSVLDSLT